MIKVTSEKVVEERAREARDKNIALKKREVNKKRAQRIKGWKEKQMKVVRRREKKGKEKYKGCRPSKRYKSTKKGQTC